MCRVQPPVAPGGRYAKDAFTIDLRAATVTCPQAKVAPLREQAGGEIARSADACQGCPLADGCTTCSKGRTSHVGPTKRNSRAPAPAPAPARPTPTVRRLQGHTPRSRTQDGQLMRREHGGRRARVRGQTKIDADFKLLAGAVNLAGLAVLGLTHHHDSWAANTA